jgi:hypothetical protein
MHFTHVRIEKEEIYTRQYPESHYYMRILFRETDGFNWIIGELIPQGKDRKKLVINTKKNKLEITSKEVLFRNPLEDDWYSIKIWTKTYAKYYLIKNDKIKLHEFNYKEGDGPKLPVFIDGEPVYYYRGKNKRLFHNGEETQYYGIYRFFYKNDILMIYALRDDLPEYRIYFLDKEGEQLKVYNRDKDIRCFLKTIVYHCFCKNIQE